MCDQDSMDDMLEYQLKSKALSRRQFGAMSLGAGLVSLLPPVAGAAEVTESEVEIKTPDGTADAYFVHPAKGKYPAVLIWPDIFGLRASFRQMGKRLAESGYSVLVVNPFYRTQEGPDGAGTCGLLRSGNPHRTGRTDGLAHARDGADRCQGLH